MKTPSAKKIEKELVEHGHTRVDNYYWMRLSDEQKNAPDSTRDQQTKEGSYVDTSDEEVRKALSDHEVEARRQLMESK